MTCVIGYKTKDRLYIASDSLSVGNGTIIVRKDSKVFRNKDFIIGFTSSFRMGNLLRYKFIPPEHPKSMSADKYMNTLFIDEVRRILKDGGYTTISENKESGGMFLVGYRDELYKIDSDFQIAIHVDNYMAIGCGEDYALGAMSILHNCNSKPESKLKKAMEMAKKFCWGVGGPTRIISMQIVK